jgi:F0F1-type ATP synthase assembly protein I
MGVNTGLISVLVVLAMGTLLLIQGIKKHLINSQAYGITVPLIAAVMSYAAAGFFNDSIVSVAPVFWMLFGLAAGAVQGFEEVVAEEMDDKLLSEQEEQE